MDKASVRAGPASAPQVTKNARSSCAYYIQDKIEYDEHTALIAGCDIIFLEVSLNRRVAMDPRHACSIESAGLCFAPQEEPT